MVCPPSTRVCGEIDTTIFGFGGFDLALRPYEMRVDPGPVLTEWMSHFMVSGTGD